MIKFTLLFLISSTFYEYTVQDTVNMTVYYESLCPFCEEFIADPLYPGYQKLGDSLVVDFVPYARRKLIDGKWVFHCQHGPDECFGNKMDGCVLKHYPNTSTRLGFLRCLAITSDPTSIDTGKKCAETNNIEWNKIVQCIEGSEGDEVMLENAILAEAAKGIYYVPWIITNGNQDQDMQNSIRFNLVETVCGLLKVKPKACFEK